MIKEDKTADEVITLIANTLAEADGATIADIANRVLSAKTEYFGDSFFSLEWPD